jgi:hypothetical protein
MSVDERRPLRQHHALPVLDELKAWIETTHSMLPQKQRLSESSSLTHSAIPFVILLCLHVVT